MIHQLGSGVWSELKHCYHYALNTNTAIKMKQVYIYICLDLLKRG